MTSSFQVRISILSRALGYVFWIKLSLVYSFRKMFFIAQNLKHVYMTHFFSWTFYHLLINSIYLVFEVYLSPHPRNIVWEHKLMGNQLWSKTNIFTCFWYWCWKNLFFKWKIKTPYKLWFVFSFINTFSEAAVCRYSSK